jgi:hypothetical protein
VDHSGGVRLRGKFDRPVVGSDGLVKPVQLEQEIAELNLAIEAGRICLDGLAVNISGFGQSAPGTQGADEIADNPTIGRVDVECLAEGGDGPVEVSLVTQDGTNAEGIGAGGQVRGVAVEFDRPVEGSAGLDQLVLVT